jgi:hypothetical protein
LKKSSKKLLLLGATQLRCPFNAPAGAVKGTPELRRPQEQKFFARFFSKKRCLLPALAADHTHPSDERPYSPGSDIFHCETNSLKSLSRTAC